jgi:hypothetical protein
MKVSARSVLEELRRRPTRDEAMGLSYADIIKEASAMGYDFSQEAFGQIRRLHRKLLPIVEKGIVSLFSENEAESPDYYPLARDCELIYDALGGIALSGEKDLEDRVHLLKLSLGMYSLDRTPNKQYFHEMGITPERDKKGPPIVMIDSGFAGTLFNRTRIWAGIEAKKILHKNFRGYLVTREVSQYNQLYLGNVEENTMREIKECMADSPYSGIRRPSINFCLTLYMQLMPKFTGRYVQAYVRSDGKWDVMPERNSAPNIGKGMTSNEHCVLNHRHQVTSISDKCALINEDVVHPPASLLLQKETLEYFTNPNIWDRVLERVKIKTRKRNLVSLA